MTRVVVGEFIKGEKNPNIIGVGESPTFGLRHGYVVNTTLVADSIKSAVLLAEKSAGVKIRRAFIALSGTTLRGEISSGGTIVSKADGEVTLLDVNKALTDCEDNLSLGNKKVIHVYPIGYRLDGKEVLGRIEGMRGTKLEAKALFVTYSIVHLEDLLESVAEAGVETIDVIAGPVAASLISISDKQKIVGVALVDIGAETTSISVFENGILNSIYAFPIGGNDVTNDIALGLKIPLEKAEEFKLGNIDETFSKKKLDEIIEARLADIFESIENNLKKIKRSELLPAGIVYIGGTANIQNLEELSKSALRLPVSKGTTDIFGTTKTKLRDSSWFTAIGLLTSGKDTGGSGDGSFNGFFKDLKNSIRSGVKQLMP